MGINQQGKLILHRIVRIGREKVIMQVSSRKVIGGSPTSEFHIHRQIVEQYRLLISQVILHIIGDYAGGENESLWCCSFKRYCRR